jgi:hypothetical protein
MNPALAYTPLMSDAWGLAAASDRRFRQLCLHLGLPAIVLAILMPWLQAWLPSRAPALPPPIRIELLPDPPKREPVKVAAVVPPPPVLRETPAPVPKKLPQAATRETPAAKLSAAPAPTARELAQAAGLMRLRDQLASMSDRNLVAVNSPQPLMVSMHPGRGGVTGESFTAGAAATSGGAGGAGLSGVSGSGGGGGLGARRTGSVQSGLGSGARPSGDSASPRAAGRGLEEIQLAFDRSKSSFNAIFSRAARETPGMGAGRVVVSLTIAPDGSVSRCELVSGGFDNPELVQKILQRVRLLNFGAKDVPPYTYPNYPIDFLPS